MKTKNYIQLFSILFFLVVFSARLFSQNSSSKKNDSTKTNFFSDSRKNLIPLNLTLIDTTTKNSILDFKPKKIFLNFKPIANDYFKPFDTPQKRTINFMSQTSNDDSDILIKRSFNGKDTSNNVKLSSEFNLGTLHTTSNFVRIEVRDHSLVDGDRIKVYVNEQMISSNIMLNSLYYIIPVDLKKGYNRIDIEAINEGYSGPNTAEIKVYDAKGYLLSAQEWNILTGQRATLGVVRNE